MRVREEGRSDVRLPLHHGTAMIASLSDSSAVYYIAADEWSFPLSISLSL